jgi:hypothetical protein
MPPELRDAFEHWLADDPTRAAQPGIPMQHGCAERRALPSRASGQAGDRDQACVESAK